MSRTLNDRAWLQLFEELDIVCTIDREGCCEIEAKTIKAITGREPRLMAKFDHYVNLPAVFRRHGISILPISRSAYVLGRFQAYQKLSYPSGRPIPLPLPASVTTLNPQNLYSESSALHCAYVSGMLEDLLGEPVLPTVSGRMSSQAFDYQIGLAAASKPATRLIRVENAQVEIDAGYEGAGVFAIVEAKKESVEDFLIRQLYYPYRLWQAKLAKPVVPIFFTHSADVFDFFVYRFVQSGRYDSMELVKHRRYAIAHDVISTADLGNLLECTPVRPEPMDTPFPQADSFIRVIDLLSLLAEQEMEKDEITANYHFDARQTNYYTSAGMYLGLIERYSERPDGGRRIMYRLTTEGNAIMNSPYKTKYLGLAARILSHGVFGRVLRESLSNEGLIARERICAIMRESNLNQVNADSTLERRASTVAKWVGWMLDLPG